VLFVSGQAANEATDRHGDSAERRRAADLSPPKPPPGSSSLQRQRVQQQQASGSLHRKTAGVGAVLYDEEDVFVVGPPGGLFQSTTDPDVSIYVPPSAFTQTITLTMQVIITSEKELDNIIISLAYL